MKNKEKVSKLTKNSSLGISLGLVSSFSIIEALTGLFTGSLVLVADAGNNFFDTITILVSLVANKIAGKRADKGHNFGHGRITIVATLVNALLIFTPACFIAASAINAFQDEKTGNGIAIVIASVVSLVINLVVAFLLSKNRRDLNIRAVFVDKSLDALSSISALLTGVITLVFDIHWAGNVASLFIAGLMIFNAIRILKEAVNILLEGVPKGVDYDQVRIKILEVAGVKDVKDLHIWAIRSDFNILNCVVVIDKKDAKNAGIIIKSIKKTLKRSYKIKKSTIEIAID